MSGVRIKDLQDAKGVIEQFDEMQFAVDSATPDATMRLSGSDLKEVIGMPGHTHSIEDVNGLPGELEKKLDTAGGRITGDLRVEGDTHVRNLRVDEYLEVPELKYNRITATGNEFWVTDGGTVDDAATDGSGVYLITLKSKEGETTINFQFKDILRGIFYSENGNGGNSEENESAGFQTAYYEVTGVIDQQRFYCVPLNDIPPERFMTLARQGNKSDENRQGSVYMDGLQKFIRVSDGVTGQNIDVGNIKVQLGDLSGIDHPVFGQLQGFGALLENAYICGRLVQRDPVSGEDWVVGAVSVSGEQVFHYDEAGCVSPQSIIITAKEQGFTSAPQTRQWQYKSGQEWVTLDTQHVLTYVLTPDAEIWHEGSTLTLRYIVAGVYYDMITITKVRNGDTPYTVTVASSNGNQFLNGATQTTLTATVFKGSTDITADLPYNAFNWTRLSDNPAADTIWNEQHTAAGNQITITGEDVYRRAVFNCEVEVP
jgi:hypothetical protein